MTMTLNDTSSRSASAVGAGRRLQQDMAAVRVSFTWLGVRRALSREQKNEAAEPFGAEGQYLSAAKKLLDTRHPAFRAVTAVRGRALALWRGSSLPFPEPGVRPPNGRRAPRRRAPSSMATSRRTPWSTLVCACAWMRKPMKSNPSVMWQTPVCPRPGAARPRRAPPRPRP